ncbi:MAG: phage terminase large subunit [Eubacterium sp.]|jgi:predicted phage terminase large subunit-like protein|nr:phage terminase large subunit [Eubacterium sp.]
MKSEMSFQAKLEIARRDFSEYCRLKSPDFYKPDRKYLKELCEELQSFYYSDEKVMIINMPPRHGKSRTVGCFVEWILGREHKIKVITGSYNEMVSAGFSKGVRNTVIEHKADKRRIVYSDIFPNTRIKKGDGAMNIWSLEGGFNNYLATSPSGTATGFGANLLIIDDLIKSSYEANNNHILNSHWEWYSNTMVSRLEEGGKVIIIMTRWHTNDLAGRAFKHYSDLDIKPRVFSRKAMDDCGEMLCPEILSLSSYITKLKTMSAETVEANFQQNPVDIKGRLYDRFKTYDMPPADSNGDLVFSEICCYTDTADTGADFLCAICYGVYNLEAYVLDVIYTKESMETTEEKLTKMLVEKKVNRAYIESNSGGRGFARNVERLLSEKYRSNYCKIITFFQSKNKSSRILSNSSWVMGHIYFPINWQHRFPEFFKSLNEYSREGKNAHDDAADAVTGIAEIINKVETFSFE